MRTVGIVRVSETKGREGDSFVSPNDQRKQIEAACERDDMTLVAVHEELDVSGGKPLERRDGLRAAVEAVEDGSADVVMVAYFDRLVRSLRVQDEVVSRVEAAGGRVVALDFGRVTGDTAAQWLSGTMIGAVSEYYRRSIRERAGEAQARAVARGVPPFNNLPPGLTRDEEGRLDSDPTLPLAEEAFRRRAEQTTIKEVRRFLAENGIERSYHGVQSMLCSRLYLGEIRFGKLVNLAAHEPFIDPDLWHAAQRARVSRGRRAKSERLLARLGVLRCGNCGARMVVGTQTQNGRNYHFYRCPPTGDCERRVTISGPIAELVVVAAVREGLADEEGRASAESDAREADAAAERCQAELDAAVRAFDGLEDESTVRERLSSLRKARDDARDRADHLSSLHSAYTLRVGADWDRLTMAEQRALIRATVKSATVGTIGKGADRLTVHLFSE